MEKSSNALLKMQKERMKRNKEEKMSKSIIVVYSYHHKNTEKIAKAMAKAINSEAKYPEEFTVDTITEYDLIGFGAGIDSGRHYKEIIDFAESLPDMSGKKAFIFSTAGVYSEKKKMKDHKALRDILVGKGFTIVGEFACPGHDTNSVLKYIGGIKKERPNADDIKSAIDFAKNLI